MAITALIKKLRDIMYLDAGTGDDTQRLSQIVWLLFLKIFDYKERQRSVRWSISRAWEV